MSTAAKITLGISCAISVGTIGYVHFKQANDKEMLRQGVLKDIDRQKRRKLENTYVLQQQIDLTKKLKNDLQSDS